MDYKNIKKPIKIIILILIVYSLFPLFLNPLCDYTINILLQNYHIVFDSTIYVAILTIIITAFSIIFVYKYTVNQYYMLNSARLICKIKPLYYYDTEFGLICSQEELPANIEIDPEKSLQLNEYYSNNYFSITLYNSGRGIAENIKLTIDFENGIWYEEILSNITKSIDKYKGINTRKLEYKLLFMDSKEKFDAYFSETLNKMVRNFCVIDIDNYSSQNFEAINFLFNKQLNIAKLKLSYEDALIGHMVTNEYVINIYVQKKLMLKKYDAKYIIKLNLEEYRHHVKKLNSSIINNLF